MARSARTLGIIEQDGVRCGATSCQGRRRRQANPQIGPGPARPTLAPFICRPARSPAAEPIHRAPRNPATALPVQLVRTVDGDRV